MHEQVLVRCALTEKLGKGPFCIRVNLVGRCGRKTDIDGNQPYGCLLAYDEIMKRAIGTPPGSRLRVSTNDGDQIYLANVDSPDDKAHRFTIEAGAIADNLDLSLNPKKP